MKRRNKRLLVFVLLLLVVTGLVALVTAPVPVVADWEDCVIQISQNDVESCSSETPCGDNWYVTEERWKCDSVDYYSPSCQENREVLYTSGSCTEDGYGGCKPAGDYYRVYVDSCS